MTSYDYDDVLSGRLSRAANDLRNLQQLLTLEGVDPRVLLDFREAVDHVRNIAWGVERYLALRAHREDPFTALSFLAEQRVKRATQLSKDLLCDLDSGEAHPQRADLEELQRTLARLLPVVEQCLGPGR